MTRWKLRKKAGMLLVAGVVAVIAFSLPIVPSSWAKTPVIKVMADNARYDRSSNFTTGKSQYLKLEAEGTETVLTVADAKEKAVYTSPVIKSKIVFTDVALHWKNRSSNPDQAEPYIHMELRYSADGKTWSAWEAADADADNVGPKEIKSNETFSNLIYAQRSQYLQYRVNLQGNTHVQPRLKDIRVTFINSEDGQKIEVQKPLWEILFDMVKAANTKPDVVSRTDWGADESLRFVNGVETWPREYHKVTHLFVHHTATDNNDPDPAGRVRAIYYFHTVTRGWGDIAYNAIIGSDGKIYEGRKGQDGDVLTQGVVGAGTYAFNYGGFSVSMMGDYQSTPLPAKMRQTLVQLLAYEARINDINPTGVSDFVRDYPITDPNVPPVDYNVNNISGHRDSKYTPGTECPGNMVYNDLPNIRKDVAAYMKANYTNLKRLAGVSRYDTSAQISNEINSLNIPSDTIVIARADLYADALSGATLAAQTKSPILLTDPHTLRTETQTEIQRRKPTKAIILGGTGAVSTKVEDQLKALGITDIQRIAGVDRYDGSALTAEKVLAGGTTDTAFIASGLNFPDALSASSVAAQKGWPILLVKTDEIPPQIDQFITSHPEIKNFYIVGGTGVVSSNVETALAAHGTVTRIGGANRYDTSIQIAQQFNASAVSPVFANGSTFPDALSGGLLAAYTQSPIILVRSNLVPPEVETYLTGKQGEYQRGYLLGGTGVISDNVANTLESLIK